jgi:antitoxin component of RelBE/YafQ-DinJ toxin-antitoxin module
MKECQITIKMNREQKDEFSAMAKSMGASLSSFVRMIVIEKINELKKDGRR